MPNEIRRVARDTGDFIVDAARGLLAAHTRTGSLSRGLYRTGVTRTGESSWGVQIGVKGIRASKYAEWVEWGTGLHIDPRVGTPHLIYPKTASVMSWIDKTGISYSGAHISSFQTKQGTRVVARYTKGQKPVHYMRDAFRLANRIYVPARLSELGLALTK